MLVRIRFVPLPQLLQLSRSNVHMQRSMLWRQNVEHLLKLAFNEVSLYPLYLHPLLLLRVRRFRSLVLKAET